MSVFRPAPPFINDTIKLVLDRLFINGDATKAELEDLQTLQTRISVPAILKDGLIPKVGVTWAGTVTNRFRIPASEFVQDTVTLGRVLMASAEYHTFPPCAFTVL